MPAGVRRHPTNYAALLGSEGNFTVSIGANADGMLYTHPWSNFGVSQDLLANDSDKTFTVPTNHLWIVQWIGVNYTATATVGTREIVADVRDASDNILFRLPSGTTLVASEQRLYLFSAGGGDRVDTSQFAASSAMPNDFILLPGYDIRVYDEAAIAAAADDMEVTIGRQEIDDS